MLPIENLHSVDTVLPADSIEWCTHPDYKDYFVCGTYQLEKDDNDSTNLNPSQNTTNSIQKRTGCIYLYEFLSKENSLREVQRIETVAGVLDMKWMKAPNLSVNRPILLVANSVGQVEMFELTSEKCLVILKILRLNEFSNDNLISLSLDVQQITESNEMRKIAVSDSKGGINLLACGIEHSDLSRIHNWSAHQFEAWTCAFDKYNDNLVFSGGDDALLKVYDVRNKSSVQTNRSHTAGVTSLLSNTAKEYCLLTGSYDEYLRIFDLRQFKHPLAQLNLGGGIWRLKPAPQGHNLILSACMYHNFSVVHFDPLNSDPLYLSATIIDHESICYGADWCPSVNSITDQNLVELFMATCSFYDHKMCITKIVCGE